MRAANPELDTTVDRESEKIMSYLRTGSGRLFTMAAGIALTGGGIAALVGGGLGVAIMCVALLLTIVTSLFAAGLGSDESAEPVILIIITAPWAFFLYVLGLGLAIEHAPQVGYAFGILGALALARAALLTDAPPAASASTSSAEHTVHAH
ncbi:MAG: hypothetical protein ABI134_29650 [Byssovorax sp.]